MEGITTSPTRSPARTPRTRTGKMMESLLHPEISKSSRRIVMKPQAHRLPSFLMWSVTLLTAVGMALINFFSLLAIEFSIQWKFQLMQRVIDSAGLALGLLVLVGISTGYAAVGACLVLFVAPNCGGSGLPESKCYLNGSNIPRFFTWRNLIVRIFTSILANAAGFPVGREGPTVTIGGNLAFLISYSLTMPHMKQWVDLSANVSTLIVEEERFAHATRINCAVGGACAMAMLFNTPIGGLLYMFEEISPAAWPVELTFRAFVATTVCALLSYGLLSMVNKEIREFVIFAWLPENKEWKRADLPVFVILAAVIGVVTAYHTRMMLAISGVRKRLQSRLRWPRLSVAWETTLYGALCALLSGLVSLLARCKEAGESSLQYVRFNCAEGEYNPVASLLVNTSHSSVKLLFSGNNEGELRWRSSSISFVTYFVLNVGLAGLPVPGGAFTATMLLGGLFGRAVGGVLRDTGLDLAVSGVYAVVGAAAMLCGFKQMAAAVVLIVVQCVNDFNITPVVMLSVSVALAVNRSINERGHDEEQIERKNLPFLECEVPGRLDSTVAGDLIDDLPAEARLHQHASIREVERALQATDEVAMKGEPRDDFPVFQNGHCIGVITRAHLQAALRAQSDVRMSRRSSLGLPSVAETPLPPSRCATEDLEDRNGGLRRTQQVIMQRVASGLSSRDGDSLFEGDMLPLERIMDPTPFTVSADMPAPRFYALFAKAGERACCVTSRTGEYLGLISRTGLIEASRRWGH